MAVAEVVRVEAQRPLVSIVIPVFDEEENLPSLIAEIERALRDLPGSAEVILVDDGSRDSSWETICSLAGGRPWIRALRFLANRGQTAAMAAGMQAARGDMIAFLDADLQNDPRDVVRLIEPIRQGTADVVCGWRADRHDPVMTRTIPSLVANFLIRQSLHLRIHDLGCTLKVFRREYLKDVALYGEMHRFLAAYAYAQGARVEEMTVSHRPRQAGKSKYGLERVGKVLIDLLTVKMLNDYGASPAYLFGKIALLFFILGAAAFGLVAYRALFLGRVEATPMVFIMMLMFITGMLTLMSGLLAELNIRVLHQVGGQRSYTVIDRIGFEAEGEERR
jgi:glycosyltransferase involved in cell wall biosynthesis